MWLWLSTTTTSTNIIWKDVYYIHVMQLQNRLTHYIHFWMEFLLLLFTLDRNVNAETKLPRNSLKLEMQGVLWTRTIRDIVKGFDAGTRSTIFNYSYSIFFYPAHGAMWYSIFIQLMNCSKCSVGINSKKVPNAKLVHPPKKRKIEMFHRAVVPVLVELV